jgi:hypothetical protein
LQIVLGGKQISKLCNGIKLKINSFKNKQNRIDWCINHGIETLESIEYQLIETEKKLGKSRDQLLEESKLGILEETELVSFWQEYYTIFLSYKGEENDSY